MGNYIGYFYDKYEGDEKTGYIVTDVVLVRLNAKTPKQAYELGRSKTGKRYGSVFDENNVKTEGEEPRT